MRQFNGHFRWGLVGAFILVWVFVASATQARQLKIKRLTPQKVERLGKETREHYDRAWDAVDRINYTRALEQFDLAVEAEPDNVYLRFLVVKLARYLGDTRFGTQSIMYYDKASLNLSKMINSPQLNKREREKARQSLTQINALRATVTERDAQRSRYGRVIILQHAKEIYPLTKEEKVVEEKKKEINKLRPTGSTVPTSESGKAAAPTP